MKPHGFFNIRKESPLIDAVVEISEHIDRPGIEAEARKELLENNVPIDVVISIINLAKKIKAELD